MTDNRTTELRDKLTERGVDWLDESNGYADVTTFIANGAKWTVISKSYLNPEHDWMTLRAEHITPEQAIAATLGSDDAFTREEVESAFVRGYSLGSLPVGSDPQWDENRQTVDEHMAELGWIRAAKLGSEPVSRGTLTADDIRGLIERHSDESGGNGRDFHNGAYVAIADELNARAELGSEPPYDELLRCLENDWHIHASWDGLRKFWCIELTEEGVKLRDAMHGTLTAEQVRRTIMDCSRRGWAGDDDCWHIEGEPQHWQRMADELNAREERTCECVEEYAESPFDGKTIVLHRCSECHELMRPHMRYCPNCGCKVVDA